MIPFTSLTGLSEHALLFAGITLPFTAKLSFRLRLFIFFLGFSSAWIPVKGLFLAGYTRGLMGDFSISLIMILLFLIFRYLFRMNVNCLKNAGFSALLVFFTGLFFYPMSLGLFMFDPYGSAYDPKILSLFLFVIALTAWYLEKYLVVFCICAAVLGYLFRILESDNLWDYVMDPFVFLLSIVYLVFKFIKERKNEPPLQ